MCFNSDGYKGRVAKNSDKAKSENTYAEQGFLMFKSFLSIAFFLALSLQAQKIEDPAIIEAYQILFEKDFEDHINRHSKDPNLVKDDCVERLRTVPELNRRSYVVAALKILGHYAPPSSKEDD